MGMKKLKLGVLLAIVVGGVVIPLVIQHQSLVTQREENQALRQQIDQLAKLDAENDRLSNLVARAQSTDDDQLHELLRLRGEVGSLRRQTNELGKLQSENQRLRSSLLTSKPATQTPLTRESLPRQSWAFVGYADPESALQSVIWAMSQGDAKTARASFAPEARELTDWRDKSDADLSTDIKREMEKVTAFKIISNEAISVDTAVLTVMVERVDHNEVTPLKLQRIGADWKLAGSVKDSPTTK
jgi:hypothetical protein